MEENKKPLIQFVHGKESGPWGRKIQYLAKIAEEEGFAIESFNYLDLDSPFARVSRLVEKSEKRAPDILVGSSMGGWVAATATVSMDVKGLFLMAPAFYMDDYPAHQMNCTGERIRIVHGWHDSVIPVSHSIQFGKEHACSVLLLDDDHRLAQKLPEIGTYFREFLQQAMSR